jgi:hypothetical protein
MAVDPGWFVLAFGGALVAISVGIWRAWEWARWAGGLVGILTFSRYLLWIARMLRTGDLEKSSSTIVALALLFFTLFWGRSPLLPSAFHWEAVRPRPAPPGPRSGSTTT